MLVYRPLPAMWVGDGPSLNSNFIKLGSEGYRGYVMQQNSLLPWRPCLEYRKRMPVVFLKHSGEKAAEDPTLIGDFKMQAPPASILI